MLMEFRRLQRCMVLNVEYIALLSVLQFVLLDSDSVCSEACRKYVKQWFGRDEIDWSVFHDLVDKIYGNQISDDPYQPQEIHLALTVDPNSMKVMWASAENLEDPFVEYMPSGDSDWSQAVKVPAANFTYEVPEYWWPVFKGVLYDVDMTNLATETKYQYRVGGYDTSNSTVRRSDDFTFQSQPLRTAEASPNRETKIATLADYGTFMLLGFAVAEKMVSLQEELGMHVCMYVCAVVVSLCVTSHRGCVCCVL